MSESKHTPGPWYVRHAITGDHRGRTEIRTTNGGIGELIAATIRDGKGAHADDANACLIAAAPEMLEALREAERVLHRAWERGVPEAGSAHGVVAAAIRKATGGEQ